MRRRIKFTGRRKLPKASVATKLFNMPDGKLAVGMGIVGKYFEGLPDTARIKLRLFENKISETLEFGTLGEPRSTADIKESKAFSAPTCQLRIVGTEGKDKGKVLGSTDALWRIGIDERKPKESSSESLLPLKVGDIAPLCWKLGFDDGPPVLYVDGKIPEPIKWMKTDPVFVSCVLPAIIRELFEEILMKASSLDDMKASSLDDDEEWVEDWLNWAKAFAPEKLPEKGDLEEKQEWISGLIGAFCERHGMLDKLIGGLREEQSND